MALEKNGVTVEMVDWIPRGMTTLAPVVLKKHQGKERTQKAQKSPRSDSSEQFSQLLLLQAFFDTFGSAKPEQGIV